MTSTLVGSSLYSGALTKSRSHSSKAATCDVPRVIGGHNRLWYELVHGKTIDGSSQCSPSRPCGGVGQDHTGGVMGKALIHSVFVAAYPLQGGADFNAATPPEIVRAGTDGTPYGAVMTTWRVCVPACPPDGAYNTLTCDLAFECSAYTAQTSLEGWVAASPINTAPESADGAAFEIDISGAGFKVLSSPLTIPVTAGAENRVVLAFTINEGIATTVRLVAFALSQVS